MHRYNTVRLEGPLHIVTTEDMKLGKDRKIPKVVFSVATDSEHVGGHHSVSAYGNLALEVLAFSLVWNDGTSPGEDLSVSVAGRLQSVNQPGVEQATVACNRVVAERVVFYVHPDVRKEAVAKLRDLKQGYYGYSEDWAWEADVYE